MNRRQTKRSGDHSQRKAQKVHHRFFLNTCTDTAFTRCPKCEGMTKVRKYPLAIHIEPHHFFCLNTTCRYCSGCDLIIAQKERLEQLLCAVCEQHSPEIIGNEYVVFGTLERGDWKQGQKGLLALPEALDRISLFKDIWGFEVKPRGWYPNDA